MDQLTLSKLLMKVNELPSLPHITGRVLQLTEDPKATPADICNAICLDQVLVTKVLRLVNSAYYGLPRRVASISEAITILGMQTLRTLVIGASIHKTLSGLQGPRAANPERIWRHAAACAVSSKLLATKLGIIGREHAFMAGLLHDIGKIILNSFMTEEYLKVLQLVEMKECAVHEAEQELLGSTHAQIGRMAAEKWNLPEVLVKPIGFHHDPFAADSNGELVQVVCLGDMMAIMAGYGSADRSGPGIDTKLLARCGLTYEQMHTMAEELRGKIGLEFL